MLSAIPQMGKGPLSSAPLRGHVEHVPDRPDGVDVPSVLAFLARREHELSGPCVTKLLAVAYEHVQNGYLVAFRVFGLVVVVVVVVTRGKEAQVSPSALTCEGAYSLRV